MLLIHESCYGRQKISLKIVIHTGYALSLYRCICISQRNINKAKNFASLLHVVSSNCNISRPMDYLSSLAHTYTLYVYDLHFFFFFFLIFLISNSSTLQCGHYLQVPANS